MTKSQRPVWLAELWLAVGFLSTLPAPSVVMSPAALGRAARWFPGVGLLIGGILWGSHFVLGQLWPAPIPALGTVAIWALLTGFLHLDGLADCCDGLLPPVRPEKRMEILRDPRLGSFGVAGLVLHLLLKGAALAALTSPLAQISGLILAPVLGRTALLIPARQPTARPGGMGDAFALGLTPVVMAQAVVVPLLCLGGLLWLGDGRALLAAVAAVAVTVAATVWAKRQLGGGVTGDVFGLVIELSELAVLLVYAGGGAWLR